jgi:hypothetical protein
MNWWKPAAIRIKEPEEENARLKRMYDNAAIEPNVAKYITGKKTLKPCDKRAVVDQLRVERSK